MNHADISVIEETLARRTGGLLAPVQSASENPRLEFREGQFFFRCMNLEGGLVERYLSNAAVREAFSGIPIDSGWLRPEVARCGDGKHGEWAVAFFAPGLYELEVTREAPAADVSQPSTTFELDRLSVPLPGLAFFGMGTKYFIFAVKTATLDPFQEIYRAPLPNVYTSGEVCWGLVKPPRANSRSIFQAWELFIKSTFNNHLASGKSEGMRDDVREVLRHMASVPTPCNFPLSDLVRQVASGGMTLDKALRQYFETGEMPE